MTTWAECHAAGMTMAQAITSTGKTELGAKAWATRHMKRWPVSSTATHQDRQYIAARATHNAEPVGRPTSIAIAPWGEIDIPDRDDTAPRNRVIRSRPLQPWRSQAEVAIEAIREMHRDYVLKSNGEADFRPAT